MKPAGSVLVVAGVLVVDGRVLVAQRLDGAHWAGLWEFPGGKVEPEEDPREALRRELREELGIETVVAEVLDVVFHKDSVKSVVILFFRASMLPTSPEPQQIGVAGLAWCTSSDLHDREFTPGDRKVLPQVRELLGSS